MSEDEITDKTKETKASTFILKIAGVVAALVVLVGAATSFFQSLAPLRQAVVSVFHQNETADVTEDIGSKSELRPNPTPDLVTHTLTIGESVTVFGDTYKLIKIEYSNSGPVAVLEAIETLESYYSHNEGQYPDSDDDLKKIVRVWRHQFVPNQSNLDENVSFGGEWHYVSVFAKSFITSRKVALDFYWVERSGG